MIMDLKWWLIILSAKDVMHTLIPQGPVCDTGIFRHQYHHLWTLGCLSPVQELENQGQEHMLTRDTSHQVPLIPSQEYGIA